MSRDFSRAARVAVVYLALAGLWVFLFDPLVRMVFGQSHPFYAGPLLRDVLLVLGSAGLVYFLAARHVRAASDQSGSPSAHEDFKRLIDAAPLAIVVFDRGRIVRYANAAAAAMKGADGSEALIGHPVFPFAGVDDSGVLGKRIGELLNGEARMAQESLPISRGDGSEGTARFSATPVVQGGERMIQLVVADVTDVAQRSTAVQAQAQAEKQIERLAYYDALTELPNRQLLTQTLERAIAKAKGGPGCVSLLIVEVYRFSDINQALGYEHGDRLLKDVAHRIQRALKRGQVAARLGASVFAVLTPDLQDKKDGVRLARELIEQVETTTVLGNIPMDIRFYAGLALYPQHAAGAELLLRRAETAKSAAKRSRPDLVVYTPEHEVDPESLELIAQLKNALQARELVVAYQPKVSLKSGLLTDVEALVRWEHPEKGLIPPSDFIPAAERTGLIGQITRYVLGLALADSARWRTAGLDLCVCVNLSARDLYEPEFVAWVASELDGHAAEPSKLSLELTEKLVMEEPEHSIEVFRRLNEIGVQVSVDDFGTGYSSLACLKRLPINELKIDRSFVRNMVRNKDDAQIVRSTIALAHELGMRVTAEGVEDAVTFEELKRQGCDRAQGFGIAKPMKAAEIKQWALARISGARK